eukprot:GHVU01185021.1.p1 GENE.GHVU01185021.1~~GHVU01185021.1.p1  ORF type:complete len:539 (-),score=42.24 GHVU01185021.1:147-1763(-)
MLKLIILVFFALIYTNKADEEIENKVTQEKNIEQTDFDKYALNTEKDIKHTAKQKKTLELNKTDFDEIFSNTDLDLNHYNTSSKETTEQHTLDRDRRVITIAAITAAIGLVTAVVKLGTAVVKLAGAAQPDPTGAIIRKLNSIQRGINEIKQTLYGLIRTSNAILRTLNHQHQWTRAVAVFGRDVQRLEHLVDQMSRLRKDRFGRFIKDDVATDWAKAVLSTGNYGMPQVLYNIHKFVTGQSALLGSKSIIHIYIDALNGVHKSSFWTKVDNVINLVVNLQKSAYVSWAVALGIQRKSAYSMKTALLTRMRIQGANIFIPLKDKRLRQWPDGTYGLLNVKTTGCPSGSWSWGKRYHDTEDRNSANSWSSPLHMAGHKAKNNMAWEFCMKTSSSHRGISWPVGSSAYCFFAKRGCPNGYSKGSLYFDDEDSNNVNKQSGTLPDGTYDSNTRYYFCCSNRLYTTGDVRMKLPIDTPFILFPLSSYVCPTVYKMTYTTEWFHWDCEDTNNGNSRSWPYPKGNTGGRDMRIEMCYYERTNNF